MSRQATLAEVGSQLAEGQSRYDSKSGSRLKKRQEILDD